MTKLGVVSNLSVVLRPLPLRRRLLLAALSSFPFQPPNGRAKLVPASRQRQFPHEQWRKNFPVRGTFHQLRLSVFLFLFLFFLFSFSLSLSSSLPVLRQLFVEGTLRLEAGGIPARRKIASDEHTGRNETVADKLEEIAEHKTESPVDRLVSNAREREEILEVLLRVCTKYDETQLTRDSSAEPSRLSPLDGRSC